MTDNLPDLAASVRSAAAAITIQGEVTIDIGALVVRTFPVDCHLGSLNVFAAAKAAMSAASHRAETWLLSDSRDDTLGLAGAREVRLTATFWCDNHRIAEEFATTMVDLTAVDGRGDRLHGLVAPFLHAVVTALKHRIDQIGAPPRR